MELLSSLVWSKEKTGNASSANLISERVRTIINDKVNQILTVEEIARMLNISREHLGRKFREETGSSPYQYILNSRIERAKLQLMSSITPVKLLADELGFSSAAQFNNVFKRLIGVTPNAYRHLHFKKKG
jgi:AraC family transcriptional regulator